ncbi:MAG: hypothetical protein ACK5PG_10375 [Lysobacterales bacterium]
MTVQEKAFDLEDSQNSAWEEKFTASRFSSESGDHVSAIALADDAWELLPEPRYRCGVSYITLLRRISARYKASEWRSGVEISTAAASATPFSTQVPVFLVKAGIGMFESNNLEGALDSFGKSWRLAKNFGFKGEDPKYLAFYKSGG